MSPDINVPEVDDVTSDLKGAGVAAGGAAVGGTLGATVGSQVMGRQGAAISGLLGALAGTRLGKSPYNTAAATAVMVGGLPTVVSAFQGASSGGADTL